ncbi:MAG: RHS repeat protein, partial [Treponemataceae bacterium]
MNKIEYDALDRIAKIDYPFSMDTCYEYGKAGEPGACEIVHKTDETGETYYRYGKLNEVTEETRTIKRGCDFQEPVTASFKYEVDYLGRMQSITYPDGEVVRYTYDAGGQ